jgi:glycosyltransferase involved in cell wall biosynthesis
VYRTPSESIGGEPMTGEPAMRIAFVTETWLPATDGVVTRLTATIRELRALGHEILVIGPKGGEPDFLGAEVRGVPGIGFPGVYGGKRWPIPLPRVVGYLREFGPDIVHVVNPVLLGAVGVRAARQLDVPLVASYHTDIARYAGYYHLGWLRPAIWWQLRRLHGRAAVNLVTSGATGAELREHGIQRVRLWRRGVDLNRFRPAARHTSGPPVALYVGRLAAEKGIDRLAGLVGSGIRLTVVGDGPQRAELERLLVGPDVTFTGVLHDAELAAAYSSGDVFVFPSTTDTLGLVLLEAMASGLPVIAADSPASREILRDCPVARLFPADRPDLVPGLVREALQDRDARFLARREAEKWGWPAATAHLLDHYHQVLGQPVPLSQAS